MPPSRFPIPQGTLDMLILQMLSLGPAHGYAIAQRLQQITRDAVQVNQGSLYPALHRLEKQGLVASDWKLTENKQRAKYYWLTAAGKKQLATERSRWQQLVGAIANILDPA
jgi:PadR family transcriptional regulator